MSGGRGDFERREIERLRHRQGQMLSSRDFRDDQALADQRRWWHNRALHDAYGVSQGFRVALWSPKEGPPPTAVQVLQERRVEQRTEQVDGKDNVKKVPIERPGLAYDCHGRELMITRDHLVPLPPGYLPQEGGASPMPTPKPMTLVARYRSPDEGCFAVSAAGACAPCMPPAALGNVAFEWLPDNWPWSGLDDGVPIARIEYVRGVRLVPSAEFAPPLVTPNDRPYIRSGVVPLTQGAWKAWPEETESKAATIKIDTSTAGFNTTPHYFAWLGHPPLETFLAAGVPADLLIAALSRHIDHIAETTATGFELRVVVYDQDLPVRSLMNAEVFWIGIEPISTRPPRFLGSDRPPRLAGASPQDQ